MKLAETLSGEIFDTPVDLAAAARFLHEDHEREVAQGVGDFPENSTAREIVTCLGEVHGICTLTTLAVEDILNPSVEQLLSRLDAHIRQGPIDGVTADTLASIARADCVGEVLLSLVDAAFKAYVDRILDSGDLTPTRFAFWFQTMFADTKWRHQVDQYVMDHHSIVSVLKAYTGEKMSGKELNSKELDISDENFDSSYISIWFAEALSDPVEEQLAQLLIDSPDARLIVRDYVGEEICKEFWRRTGQV